MIPEEMPDEQAREIKSKLPEVKALIKRVGKYMEETLGHHPEKNGRIVLRQDEALQAPDGLSAVLIEEAYAIIIAGSDELLRADLDLVLKGLTVLLEEIDDANAMMLPTHLLQRLPEEREKIVETLRPLCSEEQVEVLLG